MAKVIAPLFGFSASGKLADSLVYMTWKGLKTVRQYVIPANPKTAAQQTQRGYMTAALTAWHVISWIAIDFAAFNRWAGTLAKVMSGFNAFVKLYVDAMVAGKTFNPLYNADFSAIGAAGGDVTMSVPADKDAKLYVGTKKTVYPLSFDGVFAAGTTTFTTAGLAASTKYYCYAANTAASDAARTGIYTFETTA